ncbi:DNA-3-methyladenine glycosylase 2 family protein [Tenuifilum thalassicum]|uniref:DNA-3-methyladenine glycosylase II n=2 Tax=Tenuifilum thalassicum TaxID=2590900 RepID=A0A7D3XCZ5_9BACT|nr:DNA-3-methyladenine glycosylase 2 family protein [Tenuifilum thalassicum]
MMLEVEIKKALGKDDVMSRLIDKYEVKPLPITSDIYIDMLENIVSQQLSGRVAKVIYERFLDVFPDRYPSPDLLVGKDEKVLREVGLSNSKVRYVKSMAQFALVNDLSTDRIKKMTDVEVINLLTQVKGVGVWTAQMLLIFSLGREDVFPVDDLAIKKGMVELYDLQSKGKMLTNELHEIASAWKPYRTWGTRLIWAYMNDKKKNATRL